MIKAIQILAAPMSTWEGIAERTSGVGRILATHLIPTLVIALSIEVWGLVLWGDKRGMFAFRATVTETEAVRYALTQTTLLLTAIFGSAEVFRRIADSFNARVTFLQSFTLFAYGFSPILLARIPDAIPGASTWACWGFGAMFAVSLLYNGVGLVLKPEQTKGFGLYLCAIVLLVLSSGLAHFISVAVLRGQLLRVFNPVPV